MVDFTDFLHFNERQQERLNKIIEPLRVHLGIDIFWYSTINDDGHYTNVCSHHDANTRFFEEGWARRMDT
jgi:hypothetical protein